MREPVTPVRNVTHRIIPQAPKPKRKMKSVLLVGFGVQDEFKTVNQFKFSYLCKPLF